MAARRRFVAPAREAVAPECFAHPIFAEYAAFAPVFASAEWPSIEALEAALRIAQPSMEVRLVAQTPTLLADGLHYEQRIAEHRRIATRERNWHDLFNALAWMRHPAVKQALNSRQVAAIVEMGPTRRNRAQYALTQFDEAGVVVIARDASLIWAWDRHDWPLFFGQQREAWRRGDLRVASVFGHALLEHALVPRQFLVGKALVAVGEIDDAHALARIADAIATGALLADPQELRPLPLAGIPGWFSATQDVAFYQTAPCFQPLRPQRCYPTPLVLTE